MTNSWFIAYLHYVAEIIKFLPNALLASFPFVAIGTAIGTMKRFK